MKFRKTFIILSALAVMSLNSFTAAMPVNNSQSSDIHKTQEAFANIYEKVKDSVVNIRTKKTITVDTFNP